MFDKTDVFTSIKRAFEYEIKDLDSERQTVSHAYSLLGTLKSVLIASASYSFLNETDETLVEDALTFFREKHLISLTMFETLSNRCIDILTRPLSGIYFSDADLCALHQYLAYVDVSIEKESLSLSLSKNQRDAAGSYFTPEDLAQTTTRHAFTQYLVAHDQDANSKPCRIADLSCGAGEFLIAALYCARDRDINHVEIWAYDVDPMALLIAFSRVYRLSRLFLNSLDIEELDKRFKLGNPLISYTENETEFSLEEKEQLFFRGLFYSEGMQLSKHSFPINGFNILLGNPPWEKIRFEDRKFFDLIAPDIAAIPNKASRDIAIKKLAKDDAYQISNLYHERLMCFDWFKKFGRSACTKAVSGEPNSYVLFVQVALSHAADHFVAAQIVKTALLTAAANATYSSSLINRGLILEAYLFSNRKKIFSIDGRERFCLLYLGLGNKNNINVSFGNIYPGDLERFNTVTISTSDLIALNPQTKTLPDLNNNDEFSLLLDFQTKHKLFESEYPKCHFGRLVHLTSHAQYISHRKSDSYLDILEGKFIGIHDSRYSTFDGIPESKRYKPKVRARIMSAVEKSKSMPTARYFIKDSEWRKISKGYSKGLMLCWRSLTSATNGRTMIASLCAFQPACQSVQFLQCDSNYDLSMLVGLFNSKPFDYIVKKKIPGIDLTQSVIRQMPVPAKTVYRETIEYRGVTATIANHILARLKLIYSCDDVVSAALGRLTTTGQANLSREQALDELDELYFIAYGFSKSQERVIRAAFA